MSNLTQLLRQQHGRTRKKILASCIGVLIVTSVSLGYFIYSNNINDDNENYTAPVDEFILDDHSHLLVSSSEDEAKKMTLAEYGSIVDTKPVTTKSKEDTTTKIAYEQSEYKTSDSNDIGGSAPLRIFRPSLDILLDKIDSHGYVDVLINVDRAKIARTLKPTSLARLQYVKGRQEDLINELKSRHNDDDDFTILHTYKFSPLIYVRLRADIFNTLSSLNYIRTVSWNAPDRSLLDQSGSFLGANKNANGNFYFSLDDGEQYYGAGQKIIIMDDGVDKEHPFLEGKVTKEACFSDGDGIMDVSLCQEAENGMALTTGDGAASLNCSSSEAPYTCSHGTHVAGIAAGSASNTPYSGIASEAEIVAIQVFHKEYDVIACKDDPWWDFFPEIYPCKFSKVSDQIKAFEWLIGEELDNVAAVNLSLGGGKYSGSCDSDDRFDVVNDFLEEYPETVVVAASGNDNYRGYISAPACMSNVISVGSVGDYRIDDTQDDPYDPIEGPQFSSHLSDFTNISEELDFLAPGTVIESSTSTQEERFSYASKTGTSMATPHISGAFAILKSVSPDMDRDDMIAILRNSGTSDLASGYGSAAVNINVYNAVKTLLGQEPDLVRPTIDKHIYHNGYVHFFLSEYVYNLGFIECELDGKSSIGCGFATTFDNKMKHIVSISSIEEEIVGKHTIGYNLSNDVHSVFDQSGNTLDSSNVAIEVDTNAAAALNEIVEIQAQLSQSTAEANSEVTISGAVNYFNGEPVEGLDSLVIRRADGIEWKVSSDYIDGNEFSYRIIAPGVSSNITIEAASSPYFFEASESLYITISPDASDNGGNNDSGSNGDENGNDDYFDYDYYYPNDTEVTVSGSYGDGDDYFVYFKIGSTTSYKRLINGTFNLTKSRPTDNAEYAILEIRDSDKETVLDSATFLVREKYVSPDEDFDNSLSFTNINSSTNIKRNSSFSFGWAYEGACGQMVAFYLYQNNVLVSQDSDEEAYDVAHRDEICDKRDGMTLSHPAGAGYELRAYYDYDDKDDTMDGSVLGVSSTFDIVDENDAPIALNNLYLFAYTNGEASSQIEAVDLNDDDLSYSVNEQPSSGSISVSASGEVTYSADSSLGDYAFSVNISDGDSTTLVHGIVTVEGSANISGWREAFDIHAFTRTNERMDYIDLDVEQGYIYAAGDDASTNGGYLKKYDTDGNFITEVAILPDSRDGLPFDSLDALDLGIVDVAENRVLVGHSRDGVEVYDLDLNQQWAVCKEHSRLSCVNNNLSSDPIDAVIGDSYVFVAVEDSRELKRYDLSDGSNSVSPFWSDSDNIDEDAEYNRLFYKANYFSNMYWGLIAGSEGSEEEVYWWNIDTRNDNLDDDYKERIDVDISALFATSDYIFAGDEDGKVTIIYYSTSQSTKCESDEFVSGSGGDDITGLWANSSTIYAVAQNGSIYFLDYNCNVNGSIATGSELTAIAVEMGEIIVSDVDGHIKKYSPNRIPIVSLVADSVTSVGQELVVLASSSDPDGDELQYSWSLLNKPSGSGVSIASENTDQIIFTPDVAGEYQVKVAVSDGIASSSDTLTIAVNNNNPPEDSEQKFSLPSNSVISDTILITDIDEQDGHSLSIVSAAQYGDFYLLSDNKFSYNPSSNFIGTDQVLVLATDNYGGSGTITIIFDVQNRLPYASSQSIEVISGDSFSGVLTASDDDGGNLTFSVTTLPSKGILDYDGQGNFVYTANAGLATSIDSFTFLVNDGYDWSASSATVDITILDADLDGDGILTSNDNCPSTANPEQADLDGDAVGDVCDSDIDGDNVVNDADAFPTDPSETLDSDGDGIGNNTDEDDDGDTIPDEYELANGLDPLDAADAALDNDGDGDSNLQEYINNTDPNDADDYYYLTLVLESESADVESATGVTISFEYSITSSTDTVGDYSFIETYSPANGTLSYSDNKYIVYKSDPSFIGTDAFALVISYNEKVSNEIAFSVNVYDDDPDGDGISSSMDNCPDESNPEQSDIDSDSVGDACDSDIDGDNVANDSDAFPMDSSEWLDTDADGIGNNADEDDDGDTMPDEYELANGLDPLDAADAALDNDGDGDSNLQEYINNTDPNDADDYYYLTLVLESESADVESATGVAISFEYSIASSTDTIGDYDFIENTSPTNGILSYSDSKYIIYESDPSFIGTDAFALALSYDGKLSNEIAFSINVYDGDPDSDGILSSSDNCPNIANPGQSDIDSDSIGDVCDSDIDGDNVANDSDAFPMDSSEWLDTDADGIGNNADEDDDGDTMPDEYELANGLDPLDAADAALDNDGDGDSNLQEYINNTDPNDADDYYYLTLVLESESADVESATGVAISFEYSIASSTDTIGDYDFIENTSPANGTLSYSNNKYIIYESDPGFIGTDAFALALSYNDKLSNEIAFNVSIYAGDPDGDGIISSADNCPDIANPEQSDLDNDSIGDVCDSDIDGDGYSNADEELARSDSYDPTSVPGSIGIFAGWNLIALSLSESGLEIQDLPTEIILLSTIDSELGALGWSRDYELPSAEQLTILRIGQAYWLKSSADFVWNYPTTTDADAEELGLSEGANYIGGQQGQVQQVLASIAEAMFIAWGYKSGEWFAYSSSGDVNENLMRRGILQLTDIDRQDGLVVMLGSASDLDALLAESIWPELSYKVGSAPTIDALNCTANYDERMGYVQLVANDYDGDLEQVYWYSDGLESAFEATVPSVNEYVFDYTASEGDKFSPVVMVSDAQGNSSSASCVIDLSPEQNYAAHQPAANITVNPESIVVGDEVTLDGSGSSDPNGDDLNYSWSQPVGQGAHLSSVTMPSTTFAADAEGTYSFTLTVDDGEFNDIATINLLVKPIITPTDFAAEGGEGQVTLTWTPHSIATAHNIYRSDNPDCDLSNINHCSSITGQSTVISSVSSPFVDTGLINNTTYYYWIEATLDGDVQLADDYVSATPQHATATNSILGTLNDTGIDWYGDYPAGNKSNCSSDPSAPQDCHQGRDATNDDDSDGHAGFSFTKLDRNGNILGASATAWSCVRDNVTGLVWEVKTDDGGIHDKDNTYRWGGISAIGYDSDSREGEYYDDWDALVDGANNNKLCGYEDWRVPNINELAGIADLSRYDPAIDTNYFPNTISSTPYWSASPKVKNYDEACRISFYYGSDSCYYRRDEGGYVRLVRFSN